MSAASTLMLALEGVVVRAPGRGPVLLGPIDLTIERGEHVLLVGPSGAGKTTLLRAIAGLARPSAGRVLLRGELVSDGPKLLVPPQARRIGFVFQGGALWPHMSARGTLEFVLRARGVPRGERSARVARLLEQVDLRGFEKRRASTLSGGEAQRLALGRALAMDAELLLLDEPLGPIDGPRRAELLRELGRLQSELALTTVHVTHDPHEARTIATRTLALDHGRLTAPSARPEEARA